LARWTRAVRSCRQTANWTMPGRVGLPSLEDRGRELRLRADAAPPAVIPGCDASNQPAPAYGDQDGIHRAKLLFEFHAERALAGEHPRIVISMNAQSSGDGCSFPAGRKSFGISVADYIHLCPILPQTLDFVG